MSQSFFERSILNSPYECPSRHWELVNGIPTEETVATRRESRLITPIPPTQEARRQGGAAAAALPAEEMNFWRPRATTKFKILEQNELFLFKSKYPENVIVVSSFLLGIQPSRLIFLGKHLEKPVVC